MAVAAPKMQPELSLILERWRAASLEVGTPR